MTWSTATPAGSDSLSNGDDVIRTFKTDLQTALRGDDTEGVEAVFPGGDTANPVFRYRGLKDVTANRPAAADYGLFFDTTRSVLQRSNGTTWDDVSGGLGIVAGVVMVFYQAAAPTGWTAVAVNDKFLRVVTAAGTGGTTGGTVAASTTLAHTHTTASHTLTTDEIPAHTHTIDGWLGNSSANHVSYGINNDDTSLNFTTSSTGGGQGHAHGDTGSTFAGAFAYADVIVATKD